MRRKRQPGRLLDSAIRGLMPGLALALVILAALWLMLHYKPAWYHPAALDKTAARRARADAVETTRLVSDQMAKGDPFDVSLTDYSVNEWLAVLATLWPEVAEAVPEQITDLAVRFGEGRVWVASHYCAPGWQSIVSLGFSAEISDGGATILIRPDAIRAGSLPLPKAVQRRMLEPLWRRARRSGKPGDGHDEPWLRTLGRVSSVDELFDGVRLDNRFVWFNGHRPFRVESIHIRDGGIHIRIVPL